MVIELLKDAFWEAVVDCLVRFHGLSGAEAKARALRFRSDIEFTLGNRFEPGLIYHDEPFYIASRLSGRELDLERHRVEYNEILTRRLGAVPDVTATVPGSTSGVAPGEW
jgi:hypothetical protein